MSRLGSMLAAVLLVCAGCSNPSRILTRGVMDPQDASRLETGVSIAVVTNPDAPAAELRREIGVKLAGILAEKSFRISKANGLDHRYRRSP